MNGREGRVDGTIINTDEGVESLKDERMIDHGVVVKLAEEADVRYKALVIDVIRPRQDFRGHSLV